MTSRLNPKMRKRFIHTTSTAIVFGRTMLLCIGLLSWDLLARGGSPGDAAAQGKAALPRVESGKVSRVKGRIVASTRGKPGPVRLTVESEGGDAVSVLVAPDELCEKLGLSLKVNDSIDATGTMMPGKPSLLVVSELEVDGRRLELRDGQGRWLPSGTPREAPPKKEASSASK